MRNLTEHDATQIEDLLSRQSIIELINRYPRALDRRDRALLMSLGHADAKVQFGNIAFENWAAYVDWTMNKLDVGIVGVNHRMTNTLIRVSANSAFSETTGTVTVLALRPGREREFEDRWMHSRYLDRWSRRAGRWALDSRQTLIDYRRVTTVSAADVEVRYQCGARTATDDPSYELFNFPDHRA